MAVSQARRYIPILHRSQANTSQMEATVDRESCHADWTEDGSVNLAGKDRQDRLSSLHFETGVLKFPIEYSDRAQRGAKT